MKKQTLITVLKETAETLRGIKFNPYHDSEGRFSTGSGSGAHMAPDTGGGTGGGSKLEERKFSDEHVNKLAKAWKNLSKKKSEAELAKLGEADRLELAKKISWDFHRYKPERKEEVWKTLGDLEKSEIIKTQSAFWNDLSDAKKSELLGVMNNKEKEELISGGKRVKEEMEKFNQKIQNKVDVIHSQEAQRIKESEDKLMPSKSDLLDRQKARVRIDPEEGSFDTLAVLQKRNYTKNVSDAAKSGFTEYSRSEQSRKINGALRKGKSVEEISPEIAELQKACKSPLESPMIVYRGIDSKFASENFKKNTVYEAKGFVSTSMNLGQAVRFGMEGLAKEPVGSQKAVAVMEIKAKSGFLAAPGAGVHSGEYEVLQAHNTQYKLIGIDNSVPLHRGSSENLVVYMFEEV